MEINKTYNEDCLITMGNMVNNFIDLTITSPPYDEIRNYNKGVGKITDKFIFIVQIVTIVVLV